MHYTVFHGASLSVFVTPYQITWFNKYWCHLIVYIVGAIGDSIAFYSIAF